MSITHYYTTLFPHPRLFIFCRIQLIGLSLFWISGVFATFFTCRPLNYTWNKHIKGGHCHDIRHFWVGMSVISFCFDVSCVLLPMPILWQLNLGVAEKLRLTALFGIGIIVCGISALRIYYDTQFNMTDATRTAAPILLTIVPEPALGILAGSLPIMMPCFRILRSKKISLPKSNAFPRPRNLSLRLQPLQLRGGTYSGEITAPKSVAERNGGFDNFHHDPYRLSDLLSSRVSMVEMAQERAAAASSQISSVDEESNVYNARPHYHAITI